MGESPDSHGRVLGARLASAGPHNISQAYDQRAKDRIPVARLLWKDLYSISQVGFVDVVDYYPKAAAIPKLKQQTGDSSLNSASRNA